MIATGLIALALSTHDYGKNVEQLDVEFGGAITPIPPIVAAIVSGMGLLALITMWLHG